MSYSVLDEQIANLIDQFKQDSEDILKEFDLDAETLNCLSRLVSQNHKALSEIRATVSDFLEKH